MAAQPRRRRYGRSIAIAARDDDAADSMLGLAADVGGWLPVLRAGRVRGRAHGVRRRGRGGYATHARVAVGVIQRIYLQRGLAPGRSSRRALSVVALAATRQNR